MVNEATGKPESRSQQIALADAARKQGWLLLSGWLILVVVIAGSLSAWIQSVALNIYVFQPLLWLSVCYLAFWLWRLEKQSMPLAVDRWLVGLAILVGFFEVSCFVLAGVLLGFGKSPYSHQFGILILNTWFMLTRLAGLELTRWYLVSTLKRQNMFLGVGLAWLLLFLANLPVTRLWTTNLGNVEDLFRLFGNVVLPIASENVLLTYLSLVGGPVASFANRLVLSIFEWYSPILPGLVWTLNAFLGTVVPILGLLFVRETLDWRVSQKAEKETREGMWGTGWVLVSVFLVFIIWFNSGLFGVRPTLISGISMEPTIQPGDIVLTRDVTPGEVQLGDVVLFSNNKIAILHRVIKINHDGEQMIFITKGDNVDIIDKPWFEGQLKGKLVLVIPKLGWISIGMKNLVNRLF